MKRVYPAYGRELMRRRQSGQVPDTVLVALGFWPILGEQSGRWPHRAVVVFDDMPLARLELRMLAGLPVFIACNTSRIPRARELALLIDKVEPAERAVWVLDFEAPSFWRLLCGKWWTDFSIKESDYMREVGSMLSAHAQRPREHDRAA